jgi:hypothetical protein
MPAERTQPVAIGRRGVSGGVHHAARVDERQPLRADEPLEGRRRGLPCEIGRAQEQPAPGVRGERVVALDGVEPARGSGLRAAGGDRVRSRPPPAGHEAQPGGGEADEQRGSTARRCRGAARCRGRLRGRRDAAAARAQDDAPCRRQVEDEVQHDERHRRVAEEVVPVEHRQLLPRHPEDAQTRRHEEIAEQQHARDGVEERTRERPPGESAQRGDDREDGHRQDDPEPLAHAARIVERRL